MTLDLWLAFVAATVIVTLLPGPSMLLVMGHALAAGPRRALQTVTGVVLADAILLTLSFAGMGAVLYASAAIFTALKWAGALYLIYLGIRQWQARPEPQQEPPARTTGRPLFRQGLVVTLLNPKIIGFFVAFFPQFMRPGADPVRQLAILGATFLTLVFVIMAGYALLASSARQLLRRPIWHRVSQRLAGVTLIAAGVLTAALRRS